MRKKVAKWGLILFSVMVLFLVGDCTKTDAAQKAQYTYKTYDKSKTYKGKKSTIKDVAYYKRVVLKGDSNAVKKINRALKKVCDAAVKNISKENDLAKMYADSDEYDSEYHNFYESKVVYNANGVISIVVNYDFFNGGSGSTGCDCYTFDLKTGKQLKLTDVCNGSNKTLTKKIKNRLVKKYTKGIFSEYSFNSISANKCDFYLKKNGKVVVAFDPYEISYGGAGALNITLNSKISAASKKSTNYYVTFLDNSKGGKQSDWNPGTTKVEYTEKSITFYASFLKNSWKKNSFEADENEKNFIEYGKKTFKLTSKTQYYGTYEYGKIPYSKDSAMNICKTMGGLGVELKVKDGKVVSMTFYS